MAYQTGRSIFFAATLGVWEGCDIDISCESYVTKVSNGEYSNFPFDPPFDLSEAIVGGERLYCHGIPSFEDSPSAICPATKGKWF